MNAKLINAAKNHRDRLKAELLRVYDGKDVSSKYRYRHRQLELSDIADHIRICTLIIKKGNRNKIRSLLDGLSGYSAEVLPSDIYDAPEFQPEWDWPKWVRCDRYQVHLMA
jgi:hypothetical protein